MNFKGKQKKIKIKVILAIIGISVMIIAVLIYFPKFKNKEVDSKNIEEKIEYSNEDIKEVDIDSIIGANTKENLTEELIEEQIDLEYTTIYQNNSDLPKGTLQVIQDGVNGKQQIVTKKTYKNKELISEEITSTNITKSSIDKIVEIGTAAYASDYKVKIGDALYVTANTIPLRQNADNNSEKIITINKNTELKLLEINKDWYRVKYLDYTGWIKSECVTYLNPNYKYEKTNGATYSKAQLLSKLNKNMNLNKPSGLSQDQFKKILSNDSNDKNKIFQNNAQYFYYAEKQYGVNGVFIIAVGIHESNWGTSKIASEKKNLFGYGAYDSNAYNSAYKFSNYSEGIDLIARVFSKYYLNPSGTKIYDSEIATGRYYNGATLSGVNKKYATDKNWANAVYKWMSYLYNKL